MPSKTFFCDHTTALVVEFYRSATMPMFQKQVLEGDAALDEELFLYQYPSHFNILEGAMHGHVIEHNEEFKCHDETVRAVRLMRMEKISQHGRSLRASS